MNKKHCVTGRVTGALLALCAALAGCTGGVGDRSTVPPKPPVQASPVSGTVAGLNGATGLVLQVNGGQTVSVSADGAVSFPGSLAAGQPFNIAVLTQPLAADGSPELCTVANGTGTVSGSSITFTVSCVPKTAATDSIGGSVAGLAGVGLTLINSDGTQLAVSGNGPFTLEHGVAPGTAYAVTVLGQPYTPDQTCTVANAAGTTGAADVTGIAVTCQTPPAVPSYTIGVTVTGLNGTGASITLNDNGRDPLTVTADGSYTFGLAVPSGGTYSVSAPAGGGQSVTCTLQNASGVVMAANVTNVQVNCQVNSSPPPAFTVGGTITGLTDMGATLTLMDNGGDTVSFEGDTAFTFPTALMDGSAYAVTAAVSGGSITCTVANGKGTIAAANVTNVAVTCEPIPLYTVSATISGLGTEATVTVLDNGGDSMTQGNGTFPFATALPSGAPYDVVVQLTDSSVNYTCSVANGSGTIAGADVNVAVTCQPIFTIGGILRGLGDGLTVTLLDNGGDSMTTSNGLFTFATALPTGAAYSVTVQTNSTSSGYICTVANGTGTVSGANVSNVAVSCQPPTFTIGGSLSGLPAGAVVQVSDGLDQISIQANGPFQFPTPLSAGSTYTVTATVGTGNASCTVTNGTGTVTGTVTNITVQCQALFTIGGSVSGLFEGASVQLSDGFDQIQIQGTGQVQQFQFPTPLSTGTKYSVMATVPPGAAITCTVANGGGAVGTANVTNVQVSCLNLIQ